jgi:hypothetical protein
MKRLIVSCLLLSLSGIPSALTAAQSSPDVPQDPSALGYLNLHKRHPDGDPGPDEFVQAYSPEKAIQRLDQIRGFLESFSKLTERSRGSVSQSELNAIGNTSGEMQTIGFRNIPLVVEGTILKQAYQLSQLNYRLAQLRRDQALISSQELDRAKIAYEGATRRLQEFWDNKLPTD